MTNTEEEIKKLEKFIDEQFDKPISSLQKRTNVLAEAILKHYLPSSALVRPLVWEWLGDDCMALTPIGLYNILDDGNYYLTTPFDIEGTFYASLDEAKAAAQNHFNTIIGSCLQGGGTFMERISKLRTMDDEAELIRWADDHISLLSKMNVCSECGKPLNPYKSRSWGYCTDCAIKGFHIGTGSVSPAENDDDE